MKRIVKSQKQLSRELEREKKRKEFEVQYYNQQKFWQELGSDWGLPVDSLEEFVERKLDEWEQQQLKIPMGKYRDEEKVRSTYQKKFIEYTRQLCPQVIEELREFVPYFDKLFDEQKDKYIDVFDRYKDEIFDLDSSLDNKINYSIIKDSFLRFRPNKHENWRFDFHWGEYRLLFHFLYFLFVPDESNEKRNAILQDTIKLLQDSLVIEREPLNLPDDFDESILQNYVISQSNKVIEDFFLNDEHKYFHEESKQKITKFLQDISPTPETNIADFIKLQIELLKWAERHNLQKDWLLRYAYFFLFQFSNNPNIKLEEIEILFLNVRSLSAYPFEFTFSGWLAVT